MNVFCNRLQKPVAVAFKRQGFECAAQCTLRKFKRRLPHARISLTAQALHRFLQPDLHFNELRPIAGKGGKAGIDQFGRADREDIDAIKLGL